MTNSKTQILSSIRKQQVPSVELPDLSTKEWIHYEDPRQQFIDSVASVGGTAQVVSGFEELRDLLSSIKEFNSAPTIFSQIPQIEGNFDITSIDDPHDLEHIDFAVFQGEFAIAENGAIWLDSSNLKHRVTYFIPQHLIMVVDANHVLHNMHQAYERLNIGESPFGLFMSGPSKTADIEQSLVIGAHGARSLRVFLMEDMS